METEFTTRCKQLVTLKNRMSRLNWKHLKSLHSSSLSVTFFFEFSEQNQRKTWAQTANKSFQWTYQRHNQSSCMNHDMTHTGKSRPTKYASLTDISNHFSSLNGAKMLVAAEIRPVRTRANARLDTSVVAKLDRLTHQCTDSLLQWSSGQASTARMKASSCL